MKVPTRTHARRAAIIMDSINVASVHDTSGYASIRADTFKRGKKMEEVVKKGHAEVKRIVDGAKKVLEEQ